MGRGWIGLALAVAAGAAHAQPASRQQTYEAAQAAYDRGDWAAAASGFAQVLNPPGRDNRSDGLIRGRRGYALQMLGRYDEAETAATRAIAELTPSAKDRDLDLADMWTTLGLVHLMRLEMEEALAAYDRARALLPEGVSAFAIDSGTISAAMVTHPDRAAAAADAALADRDSLAKLPKPQQAMLLALRARVELNRQRPRAAIPFIDRALALATGLSAARLNLIDASVRGDAALIYTRLNDVDNARRYLAYSGAGYIPSSGWLSSEAIQPPVCGGEIRPDDVAVVEFGIGGNGAVTVAQPVYASRAGEMGVAFARAVRTWKWEPQEVAKLDPFWRGLVRLELRCMPRPTPLQINASLTQASDAWLEAQGVHSAAPPPGRTEADAARQELTPLQRAVADAFTINGHLAPTPAELDAALVQAGAPPAVRAVLGRRRAASLARSGSRVSYGRGMARALREVADRITPQPGSGYAVA